MNPKRIQELWFMSVFPEALDEIERLREALKFYAAEDWYYDEFIDGHSEVQKDIGDIARKALEEK